MWIEDKKTDLKHSLWLMGFNLPSLFPTIPLSTSLISITEL